MSVCNFCAPLASQTEFLTYHSRVMDFVRCGATLSLQAMTRIPEILKRRHTHWTPCTFIAYIILIGIDWAYPSWLSSYDFASLVEALVASKFCDGPDLQASILGQTFYCYRLSPVWMPAWPMWIEMHSRMLETGIEKGW